MRVESMGRQGGFTLIELMIAIVVVAVLSAVALPSYQNYIARSRVTDAVAGLSDMRIRMEQYYQDNRNYGAANAACPVAVPTSQHFTFACLVGNATPSVAYNVTATSSFGTAGAYTYTINEQNARGTGNYKGTAVNKGCWLIRGTEC